MSYSVIAQLTTPTSDVLSFTGLSLSGFEDIIIKLDGITVGTDGAALTAQFSIGGSFVTSGYRYAANPTYSSVGTDSASTSAASMLLTSAASNGIGNATNEAFSGVLYLFNATLAVHKTIVGHSTLTFTDGTLRRMRTLGHLANTGTIDGIRFQPSTGTMPTGKATIIGIS